MGEGFVVIVLPISTSMMYIPAARSRGLEPIVLVDTSSIPGFGNIVQWYRDALPGTEIAVCQNADEAMDILKGRNIRAVFPGGDPGVSLADELCKRLGLRGNDPSTTWLRTTKLGMATALERAGIRHMRTKVVKTEEDVKEFWKTCDNGKCAVKYTSSSASMGFKVCENLEECIEHVRVLSESTNNVGEKCEILMQEFVIGDEYSVNTVSFDGKHVITDLWSYRLKIVDGNVLYDMELLPNESSVPKELLDYAFAVLDATGFRNGICHSEYFCDPKGPVLIETNPRMMGLSLTEEFQRTAMGRTYADYAFATLDEKSFSEIRDLHFDTNGKHVIVEQLTAMEEGEFDPEPTYILVSSLPSFYSCDTKRGRRHVTKTIGLGSSLGNLVFMAESRESI